MQKKCDKVVYRSEYDAKMDAYSMFIKGDRSIILKAYRCRDCHLFHLSKILAKNVVHVDDKFRVNKMLHELRSKIAKLEHEVSFYKAQYKTCKSENVHDINRLNFIIEQKDFEIAKLSIQYNMQGK